MLFSNTLETLPTDVIFDDTPLEKVAYTKFLGIIVDNKLSWKFHIDNICKTISRNIGIIHRLKFYIPVSSLLMLYSSLILPYLNYGILAWGNTHQNLLDTLDYYYYKRNRYVLFAILPSVHIPIHCSLIIIY